MATAKSVSNLAIILSADTSGATKGFRDVEKEVNSLGQKVRTKNIFNPLDAGADKFFAGFKANNLAVGGQLNGLWQQATTLPKKAAQAMAAAGVGGGTGGGGGGRNNAGSRFNASSLAGGAIGSLLGGKIGGVGGLLGGMFGGPLGAAAGVAIGSTIDQTFSAITASLTAGVHALAYAVKEMVIVGAEYEMAIAAFSAATGSDEGGRSMLKGLQSLAAGTIFSSEQLSQQSRILLGYGVAANKVLPTITRLALIAQASGRGEQGLAGGVLAFAQTRTVGHLQGQERRQFSEAGVGAKEFAKTMGVTEQQFEDMLHAGQVGFDVVAKTINRMGTEAETVGDKINRTLIGRFNSVKDLALQTFGEIGLGIINAFKLPDALAGIAGFLTELPRKAQEFLPYLERAKSLLMPIITGLYAGFSVAFDAGKAFLQLFLPSMEDAQFFADGIGQHLARGIGIAIDLALTLGKVLLENLRPAAMIFDRMASLVTDVKLPSLLNATNKGIAGIWNAQREAGPGGFRGRASELFKQGIPELKPFNAKFNQEGADEGMPGLSQAVRDLAKTINENGMTGKGQSPFTEFQTNFANLMKAEQAGSIQQKSAADAFLFQEFKKLTGSLGRIENTLPAAIDRFTVEGQSRIEKVIANMQGKGQDDVPAQLRMANELHRKQLEEQKRVVEQLRRLAPQIPFQVG